mgnify:CR=1 FL=1
MIKILLFDFNGVIIDDEPIQMKAYQEVLKTEEIELTEENYYDCLGMNDEVFLQTNYKRVGKKLTSEKTLELAEAKTAKWRELIDKEIPLFEGVDGFIKRMENHFALGLVSMARRPEVEYVLEKTGLEKSFSAVITAEDVNSTKPDPECYKKGFSEVDRIRTSTGRNPATRNQCVVIEDSPPGIVSGKSAGLNALGVTSTVAAEELRKAGADAVTGSLRDWSPESFSRVFG